jgi:hypothetical protein
MQQELSFWIAFSVCHRNGDEPPPFGLLCKRSERPRGSRAAEKRDEPASLHVPPDTP